MSMVNIQKGKHIIRVSKMSYETMFKNKGYHVISDDKETKKYIDKENQDETESTDVENGKMNRYESEEKQEEIETIPISEMNKEQLIRYAEEHNIDTTGARNVREARQIIREHIKESKM